MTGFVPKKSVRGVKVRHINYTCNPEQYERMKQLADGAHLSMKELLRQCVDYALDSMPASLKTDVTK